MCADGVGGRAQARDSSLRAAPSAQDDKIIVILRSAATKDLALARSPDRAITQGWRAEVVAQASFSWPFGPIHLLAPYETAASLPSVRARRAGRACTARPYGVQPLIRTSPSAPDGAATSP